MTRSERRGGNRSLAGEVPAIRSGAAVEAIALGHPEVDVDHLLLGLLVVGGPSARALTRAGVDLQAVRRAVLEVQEEDLSALGFTAASQDPMVHAADRHADLAVPVNGRARDLLDRVPQRGDDRGLLLALLDDDGQRTRRLLEHAGVDVDRLRERAERDDVVVDPAPEASTGPTVAALYGPVPAGMDWMEAAHSQILPVPVHRVWALVSDPSRRPQWDATCAAVRITDDGVEELTGSRGRTVTQSVVQFDPGRVIAWREYRHGVDGIADRPTQVLQVVLYPDGDTTRVHLRGGWATQGLSWRLLRSFLVKMIRTRLRVQAQGIAQAA